VARTSERAVAKEKVARYFVSILRMRPPLSTLTFTNLGRRNVVNILLYVAEQSKRYYPATEIPAMREIFIPMLTKDVRFILGYHPLWNALTPSNSPF
jgi:hypothetical protein